MNILIFTSGLSMTVTPGKVGEPPEVLPAQGA